VNNPKVSLVIEGDAECLHCWLSSVITTWTDTERCDEKKTINALFEVATQFWATRRPGARPSRSDLHTILDQHLDESLKDAKRLRSMN
jgi:hypothetical protein